MYAFYRAEVEIRRKTLIMDAATNFNIERLSEHLTSETSKLGILLCGACGNGKTTLLLALQKMINWLRDIHKCFDEPEYAVMNMKSAKEIAELARDEYLKYYNLIQTPKILAIDDIGEEQKEVLDYGNVKSPVIDLIETRYDMQLPLYMTSNKSPETITKEYGDRIGDRLYEMMDIIVFDKTLEESYRRI